uniref:D(1B) dopamine receptor n=1 Tax=Gadus morhua TaxID=8049 RepID=A0A8C5A3U2_GADMO
IHEKCALLSHHDYEMQPRFIVHAMNNATGPTWTGSTGAVLARQAVIGCVLTLLIVWTFLGNLTVCVAVFRFRHLQSKVTNIFIVSLALSDLLVAALVMPWKAVAEVVGSWPFGAFCNTWVACDIMCSTASILNLCVISVDRYWAISSPFRYERSMNRKLAFVIIGVTWTVSVVISFVPVQMNWHRGEVNDPTGDARATANVTDTGDSGELCDSSLSRTYAISSSLISFYIPVAVMIITYTRIYRIAHMQIRRISSLERAADHATSCRSDRALRVSLRKETKVLKTLSIIMGVFVCCWTPFFVLNCALPFCPKTQELRAQHHIPYCVSKRTFDVFVWIGWSNSSLNPIIYAFNTDFRDAFLRLLGCRVAECWGTTGAGVETVVASNEQPGSVKQDSSLYVSYRVNARGSEDSGNTTVTLFCNKVSQTSSDPGPDTLDKMDNMDVADNGLTLGHIPR